MPLSSSVSLNFHLTSHFSTIILRSYILCEYNISRLVSLAGDVHIGLDAFFMNQLTKKQDETKNTKYKKSNKATTTTTTCDAKQNVKNNKYKNREHQMSYGKDSDEMEVEMEMNVLVLVLVLVHTVIKKTLSS